MGGLAVATGGSSKVMDLSRMTWRKSSYSGANGGECIEVAATGKPLIAVRDSKDPNGPKLALTQCRMAVAYPEGKEWNAGGGLKPD